MEVPGVADSPCRPRSALYAVKGYPNYAEEPDFCGPATPCRPRSARHARKECLDYAEPPDARAVHAPCRPRSARDADKGRPSYAGPSDVRASAAPSRPRSVRYAEKEYPDYAEPDVFTDPMPCRPRSVPHREGVPGRRRVRRAPRAQDGRGRRPGEEAGAALRKEEGWGGCQGHGGGGEHARSVAPGRRGGVRGGGAGREKEVQDGHRAHGACEVLALPKDNEEVASVDGGGSKSWRLHVKETLRAFSRRREEQQREQAVRQELKASRALKRQANNQDDKGFEEVKRPSKRPDLKALPKMQATNAVLYPEKRIGHLPGVDVGDQFYSRAEMVVLGIHGHWMKGIDYMVRNIKISCVNRTSQQGLQYRLEVFKTELKGWGVRTWDTILPGALICEYTGVLRRNAEVEGLLDNYIFDIDCLQTIKGLDGRKQRSGSELHMASLQEEHDSEASQAPEYCIDAGSIVNIARFINHSCQPNLFIQCVLSSHRDIKLAKIMLVAADTIPPLQELSYDYGYGMDSVIGPDGNVVKLACHCGASDCRERLD